MNRKDFEFAKKAARTAYQQAIRDAGGGDWGQPIEEHQHPDYSLKDHTHDDPPSLVMTYTHRFELGKDGALWDYDEESEGQQIAVLPKVDADGKEFAPERSLGDIRVALDEKGEKTADWDNVTTSDNGEIILISYTCYYFQDQPQDELFFDIGWALGPSGNRGPVEIQEDLEQLKKLVARHSTDQYYEDDR